MSKQLLSYESPLAARPPKTDRLILASKLDKAARDNRLDQAELQRAHAILAQWAARETSGASSGSSFE